MRSTSSLAFAGPGEFIEKGQFIRALSWFVTPQASSSSSISSTEVLPASQATERARTAPMWISHVFNRVVELSKCQEDWDSYGADRLNVSVLRAFVQVLVNYTHAIQTEPLISLTDRGGLLCSWQSSQAAVDLFFEPDEVVRIYYEDTTAGREFDVALHEAEEVVEKW